MAFSTSKMNLKGGLFGPPNPKDYRMTFKDVAIPDKVDLRQYCTTVEDQGQLGSCTANATVGALEYLYTKRDGRSVDLSRLFAYYNSRRIRGTISQDSGAYICDAMASILAFGVCREDIWPYNINTFTAEPSQQAYQEAMMHEAVQYARVDGADGSINALALGFPVVFGTRIPERCYQEAASTGVFPIPSDEEIMNNQGGGHCMLIVGYDKPKKIFLVRNSWGERWGDRGYCYIPFEVMVKCSPPDGFWVVGELAKPGKYGVIRPGKSAGTVISAAESGVPKTSGLSKKTAKMREEIRASLDAEIDASSRRIEKILSGTTGGQKSSRGGPFGKSVTCPLCEGSGKGKDGGDCIQCGGVGFIAVPDKPLPGQTGERKSSRGGPFGDEETCPLCGGSGKNSDDGNCRQCGGSGYITVYNRPLSGPTGNTTLRGGKAIRETATCPICQGDGACPSCSGKGADCQRCGGTGKCPVCGGTGTVGN
jgi:hypothetical protein